MKTWKTPPRALMAAALSVALTALAPVTPRAALLAQRCGNCAAEDTVRRTHVAPALGFRVGAPQRASVAVGVLAGENWQSNGRDHSRNVSLFVEPGLSAGRASLAYFDHGYGSFGSGFGLAASVMRTWRDPWWAKENVTYVGGEAILWPIVFLGPRVGVFRAVGATGSGLAKRWLVSLDLGFGL